MHRAACATSGWMRTWALLLCMVTLVVMGCVAAAVAAAQVAEYRVIPEDAARIQWNSANGFCGECSLQVAGLQFGLWVGQNQARRLAGGEALVGENYGRMLRKLRLRYADYPQRGRGKVNRERFLRWIRNAQMAGHPVVFCVKTHDDWGGDPYYDHIIIAHAVVGHASGYHGTDVLRYSDHFDGAEWGMTFNKWRDGWRRERQYYYLPEGAQYGTKITGIAGEAETLPISLTVPRKSTPNVTLGKAPVVMDATVNMSGLTAGDTYSLLRWNATWRTIGSVPFTGLRDAASPANVEYSFTATSATMTRAVTFLSSEITVFRLVPGTVGT